MAWKEVDSTGVPKLDFTHPRVMAAMRVTGITESDFRRRPPPLKGPGPSSPYSARATLAFNADDDGETGDKDKGGINSVRSECAARSRELWERKQRLLLRELDATADALEEAGAEAILEGGAIRPWDAAAESERSRGVLDQMRNRFQAQLRREAQREVDRCSTQAASSASREAVEKRIEEKAKEDREALQAKAEKREAVQLKVQARLKEKFKARKEIRDETVAKRKAAEERVDKMQQERGAGEKGEERRRHLVRVSENLLAREINELEHRMAVCKEVTGHILEIEQRLTRVREERAAPVEGKRSNCPDVVRAAQAQQERLREKQFLEKEKKTLEAKQALAAKAKEDREAQQAVHEKHMAKLTTNRQAVLKKRRDYTKETKARLAENQSKAESMRDSHLEELTLFKSANRNLFADIVARNKDRSTRGENAARQQMLLKIMKDKERSEAAEAAKESLSARRVQLAKDAMEDRGLLDELKRLEPSSEIASRRINEILKTLDMPPLALPSTAVAEGKEGQQQ